MRTLSLVLALAAALAPAATADSAGVGVRYPEGSLHGFLTLSTLEGQTLADGELLQSVRGARVTSRLVLHFRDGSLQEETSVFTQRGRFRLVSDHLVQKGPAFPRPMDVLVDAAKSRVIVRSTDDDGREKTWTDTARLPADVSNGIVSILMKNLPEGVGRATVSMVGAGPKPRLIELVIAGAGEDDFTVGVLPRKAIHYVVKVDLGGVAGAVAPIVGKQPPDTHVWILGGPAPTFLKSEGPLFLGGPAWRLELSSPSWKKDAERR